MGNREKELLDKLINGIDEVIKNDYDKYNKQKKYKKDYHNAVIFVVLELESFLKIVLILRGLKILTYYVIMIKVSGGKKSLAENVYLLMN